LSLKAQNSRISFLTTLLNAWDNVVLGNGYNFGLWDRKANRASLSYVNRNLHTARFRQWFSVLIAALTFIPSFFVVIQMVVKYQSNPLVLSAIAVTLPRLFMILNFTYDLLKSAFCWPSQKKILERVQAMIGKNQEGSSFTNRIQWGKISVLHNTSNATDETEVHFIGLEEIIKKSTIPGRHTIRGENGSGKTSLLLAIKEALQEKAFFLPVKHQLYFRNNVHYLSSGQGIKTILLEIRSFVNEKVILLDEWDANLDNQNKEEISHLIDELARNHCVIEVRHRS
jgi:ABC-type transport system involved in cytochrome c biogenesis ATPase subunit